MEGNKSKSTIWVLVVVLVLAGLAAWVIWGRGNVTDEPGENGEFEPVSLTVSGVGFATPESVQYDEQSDLYLVSNINGQSPIEKNGQGFISQVSPEGEVVELKWINGEDEDVELNAPKGMGFSGDELYVADIDVVRVFDRESGEPVRNIEVEGATFLNGIAVGGDDTVYVSDSGLTVTEEGFVPTDTDAVYKITGGQLETLVADPELMRPNGLAVHSNGDVMMVPFGSNEVFHINADGTFYTLDQALPEGSLDGLAWLEIDSLMLVSSWDGQAIYKVDHSGQQEVQTVAEGLEAPADIGYDSRRNRLLIPLFNGNSVEIRTVTIDDSSDTGSSEPTDEDTPNSIY